MEGTIDTTAVSVRSGAGPAIKRAFDFTASGLALVLVSPVLAVVALLIAVDSRGPVLFRQSRLGQGLEPFTVLKFRTMQASASDRAHREYIARLAAGEDDGDGLKKLTVDPRVTRIGRLLRRLSIDELPQLLNVVRGDMSLVGPRPAIEYELEHYDPKHYERFSVKPGITGLWQVSGRNRLGFLEMLDLDVEYARTAGIVLDLKILAKTPLAAVRGAA